MAEYPVLTRRQFLEKSTLSAGCLLTALAHTDTLYSQAAFAGGRFVELLEFKEEGPAPVGAAFGKEMDQRRFTDLSHISPTHPVTPTNEFFVRTGASELLPHPDTWTLSVDGLVKHPLQLEIQTLRRAARPMGLHLMECAGNVRLAHFGLISVAHWSGIPISEVLARAGTVPGASQVTISGFDQYAVPSSTSVPGAEWIFPLDTLQSGDAFLATHMNGEPLTRDHGAPVRLVVPGWYGCCCIKWVQSIGLVDDTVESTSQMREYAVRMLQDGNPVLAKSFDPATIDHAAIPVRVEKWKVAGKLRYRVCGILWGGTEPVKTLQIRFNPNQKYVPVQGFRQDMHNPWTLWEHTWSPLQRGMYAIQLAVSEPQVRARKMDAGYYARFVEIGEV